MPRNESNPSAGFTDQEGILGVTPEADDIVAISLQGEFDMGSSPMLVDEAQRALDEGRHLILDLSEATFVDSSILNAVLRTHRAATSRGQVAVLQLGSAAIVERVLALTGIEQVLPRADDRAEAIETIRRLAGQS
jgi:anti-sigma B factor antagonist